MISYIDKRTNKEIALMHCYVDPHGKILASGKLDPKRLFINGTVYRLKPSSKQ
ncbi:MAG: hypothetical protein M1319_00635 [Chloroflexi bacterium]|nr:hypothetical protein [Chloroflexota bacterium]